MTLESRPSVLVSSQPVDDLKASVTLFSLFSSHTHEAGMIMLPSRADLDHRKGQIRLSLLPELGISLVLNAFLVEIGKNFIGK